MPVLLKRWKPLRDVGQKGEFCKLVGATRLGRLFRAGYAHVESEDIASKLQTNATQLGTAHPGGPLNDACQCVSGLLKFERAHPLPGCAKISLKGDLAVLARH